MNYKEQIKKISEMRSRRRRPKVLSRRFLSSPASYDVRSAPEEPKEEDANAIPPAGQLHNEIQSQSDAAAGSGSFSQELAQPLQLFPVQSYNSQAGDALIQVDPIPNITTPRTMSTGAHSRDGGSGLNEEQVIDGENPGGYRQSWSIGYSSKSQIQIPEAAAAAEVPSMHEQDGSRLHTQTSTPNKQQVILVQRNGKTRSMKQQAFLHQAALKGDWKSAEAILREDQRLASLSITQSGETALHIAAGTEHTAFVRELIKLMSDEDLALADDNGNTAFCFAAASGVVDMAKLMYERNRTLPTIRGSGKRTPLYMAALLRKREMVSFLFRVTPHHILQPLERSALLEAAIHINMFDLALYVFNEAASSAGIEMDTIASSALRILACKPAAVTTSNQESMRKKFLTITRSLQYIPWMKRIHDDILKRKGANQLIWKLLAEILMLPDDKISEQLIETNILSDAVEVGNVEFLATIFRLCPELVSRSDADGRSIFHVAVLHRQECVFNLIYEIGAYKELVVLSSDKYGNNILHLAAKLPTRDRLEVVSGAALQMQRELLWFKEMEKLVPPSYLKMKNKEDDKTPRELFSKEHEHLLDQGEKWMKDTANSCMLVATLIATVVFAAAFTAPGGNNEETGLPIFLDSMVFKVFVVSDAVGMFTSSISIIVFLSILTSCYAEDDFLTSLPTLLMVGLSSLFVSILTMVIAFTSTFFLVYKYDRVWVPRLIGGLACLPVIVFALLQYRLWIDTVRSTYLSKFLFRPSKYKLYQ